MMTIFVSYLKLWKSNYKGNKYEVNDIKH